MLYSHSRINCFEECPRCFKFRYIDQVPVEYFETVEQFMGSRVHESLEMLYKELLSGKVPALEEVVDYYDTVWGEKICDSVVVNANGLSHTDYHSVGAKCLVDYYLKNSPFTPNSTVACELRINVDLLGDGNYKLIGFIDRLDLNHGVYEIHDYKTTSKLPGQGSADKDRQLAIYELGLRKKYPSASGFEYVWHYLRHGKQLRSKRSGTDLDNHKVEIIKSIHRIEEAVVEDWFPPLRTPKCSWCEYQHLCKEKAVTRQTIFQL